MFLNSANVEIHNLFVQYSQKVAVKEKFYHMEKCLPFRLILVEFWLTKNL